MNKVDSYNIPEGLNIPKIMSWCDLYSKGSPIDIVIDEKMKGPAAIDLGNIRKPRMVLNPGLMMEKLGYTEQQLFVDVFHEAEHFEEESKMRSTEKGRRIYEKRNQRLIEAGNRGPALHKLENVLRDCFVDDRVISPEKAPVLKKDLETMFAKSLYKETDYTKDPLHIQFVSAIGREYRLPDKKCILDPKVRIMVERLKRNGSLRLATTGNLEERLMNLWEEIEPYYLELLEEDINNHQMNNPDQGGGEHAEKEPGGSGAEGIEGKQAEEGSANHDGEPEGGAANPAEQTKDGTKKKIKEMLDGSPGGQVKNGDMDKNEGKPIGIDDKSPVKGDEVKDPFEEYHKERNGIRQLLEESVGKEKLDQMIAKIGKNQDKSEEQRTLEQLEMENRIKNIGIDKNSTEFQNWLKELSLYEQFLKKLMIIVNPQTRESVMEEIERIFQKIKSKRLKPKFRSRGPVDIEMGIRLDGSSLAEGIAELHSGNFEPLMFEEDYIEQKEAVLVGDFDLTLITDGSQSMAKGGKNPQQKIACMLIFEALKRLHDKLEDAAHEMRSPLKFTTSGIMFKGGASIIDIKSKSSDFKDKERLSCFKRLDYCGGGSTNDYDAIGRKIDDLRKMDQGYLDDLKNGKAKMIVIVLTDGDSSNSELLKEKLEILRSYGVIVYGIGITSGGSAVVENYLSKDKLSGYGKVCDDVEELSFILESILFEHLHKL